MEYKRFISYLYSYVNGEKGINVGYIRCEQRQGVCRLILSLQDRQGIEGGRYKVYLYKLEGDKRPVGYYLDEMLIHRGHGELRKQTNCDNVWNTSRRIGDFDGIAAIYDSSYAYASQWTDEPIELARFQTYVDWREEQQDRQPIRIREQSESEGLKRYAEEQERRKAEAAAEVGGITAAQTAWSEKEAADANRCAEAGREYEAADADRHAETASEKEAADADGCAETGCEYEAADTDGRAETASEREAVQETKAEGRAARSSISDMTLTLMAQRPKLPDFENHEIYDCVRIEPKDIGLLEMENWKLGVNSFLTHGYYNYKYLLLGKLRFQDGAVRAVLGVPGIYDGKEQYIARIFGFELFVPVKHTNIKTGNFGYWIVELA